MMDPKESVIRKVKALLEKTESSGASREEAFHAIQQANELMKKYMIEMYEIEASDVEKLVLKKIDLIKYGYDLGYFYPYLAKAFDCEFFYNKTTISFYGHQTDVELCLYFYDVIINSAIFEKEKFQKSIEYKNFQEEGYHGRFIVRDFLNGFLSAVSRKLLEMYEEKESFFQNKPGMILVSKKKRVKEAFDDLNLDIKTIRNGSLDHATLAAANGYEIGKEIPLSKGINYSDDDSKLIGYFE